MFRDESDITESQAMAAQLDGLKRLCAFVGMPPGSNGDQRALVKWLAFMGYIVPSSETRERMLKYY